MFRSCCGKRSNAKKSATTSGSKSTLGGGSKSPAASDAVELVDPDDGATTRPESALLLRNDNDSRNIDNNSVLVEFQENVLAYMAAQSTDSIPGAITGPPPPTTASLNGGSGSVADLLKPAFDGQTVCTNCGTLSRPRQLSAVAAASSPAAAASQLSATPSPSVSSDRSSQPHQPPHIVSLIPKTAAAAAIAAATDGGDGGDTTSDDNTIISCDGASGVAVCGSGSGGSSDQLRSCLSRRTSSVCSRKHVEYSERALVIDADGQLSEEAIAMRIIEDLIERHAAAEAAEAAAATSAAAAAASTTSADRASLADDDEVFSDSIEPKLPRGDMCTPYPKKRSSIPGVTYLPDWFALDEESSTATEKPELEPPVTPVGRDDLALRRHRFFNDLLKAAQATREHRVCFNPLGPKVAAVLDATAGGDDCNPDPSSTAQLNHLVDRLERIVERLERTVSARELEAVNATLNAVLLECFTPPNEPTDAATTEAATAATAEQQLQQQLDSLPPPLPSPVVSASSPVAPADQSLPSPPTPTLLLYNGTSVDLDSLPTVINEPLQQQPPSPQPPSSTPPPPSPSPPPPAESPPLEVASLPANLTTTTTIAMSVLGYQDIVDGPLAQYLALSAKIGGDVATHAASVQRAFAAQLAYVQLAAGSAKPSDADQPALLQPTSAQIAAIQEFREKHRSSPLFNHLSAISESIPALGWVCVAPTPGPHVKEMNDAGQFYTNRVLKDWKDKDATHVEWARSWVQTLTELQKYVRQHHTTGLVWAGKVAATGAGGAPPPPPPGGMPPPPPMLPPLGDLSLAAAGGDDRSALFSQINQGEDITKSLKKVTADMQTHKNTALRSGPAPFKAPSATATSVQAPVAKAAAAAVVKTPVFKQDGKKWIVEHQKNNPTLLVENAEMNNVVYLFKCEGSTLTVKGKINGIIVDSCKKCSILFDNLVSSVEFVNCQSVQMQVLGSVPTISIDKTDGCQMYLSDKSLDVEIISSKSSEMNVLIPKGNGDYIEKPVPEQFRTKVTGESLTTTCVESLG